MQDEIQDDVHAEPAEPHLVGIEMRFDRLDERTGEPAVRMLYSDNDSHKPLTADLVERICTRIAAQMGDIEKEAMASAGVGQKLNIGMNTLEKIKERLHAEV